MTRCPGRQWVPWVRCEAPQPAPSDCMLNTAGYLKRLRPEYQYVTVYTMVRRAIRHYAAAQAAWHPDLSTPHIGRCNMHSRARDFAVAAHRLRSAHRAGQGHGVQRPGLSPGAGPPHLLAGRHHARPAHRAAAHPEEGEPQLRLGSRAERQPWAQACLRKLPCCGLSRAACCCTSTLHLSIWSWCRLTRVGFQGVAPDCKQVLQPQGLPKDIHVSFVGTTKSHALRREMVEQLQPQVTGWRNP